MDQHGVQRTPKDNQKRPKLNRKRPSQNGSKGTKSAPKGYPQNIENNRCSEKVGTGTSTLIQSTRPRTPFFQIYCENFNFGILTRCQHLSQINAKTGTEIKYEKD